MVSATTLSFVEMEARVAATRPVAASLGIPVPEGPALEPFTFLVARLHDELAAALQNLSRLAQRSEGKLTGTQEKANATLTAAVEERGTLLLQAVETLYFPLKIEMKEFHQLWQMQATRKSYRRQFELLRGFKDHFFQVSSAYLGPFNIAPLFPTQFMSMRSVPFDLLRDSLREVDTQLDKIAFKDYQSTLFTTCRSSIDARQGGDLTSLLKRLLELRNYGLHPLCDRAGVLRLDVPNPHSPTKEVIRTKLKEFQQSLFVYQDRAPAPYLVTDIARTEHEMGANYF